ncbi:MAG: hypothetical protein ACI3V0_08875 [Faecousia sp.]
MNLFMTLLAAALTFGLCYVVDKRFTSAFRGKAQHQSGLAVRVSKRYGVFGVGLTAIGILSICVGITGGLALLLGGIVVLILGICLGVYYLTHGIFYDGDSFLVASFRNKDRVYQYRDIQEQKLYLVQGGSMIIELYMADGTTVSLQSTMEGVYPFLDTAFAGWCLQKGIDPETCDFHDPSNSLWFPQDQEE